MLIDTHSHINFSSFSPDRKETIKRSLDNNTWMINVGTNLKTSQEVIDIAEQCSVGVYAAIGLHPINLDTGLIKIKFSDEKGDYLEKDFDYQKYQQLAKNPKVMAIGEVGLDYYWKPKTTGRMEQFKQKQKDLLLKELELAQESSLPVIFHCRMAHDDLLEILSNNNLAGVIHCFTGTWEQAQKYMSLGFYLGFNGIIFKLNLDEIIKKTPLDRILVETDCPYLPPLEFKGQRNEPAYVKHIAKKIADIKEMSLEKISEATTNNAKSLFKIKSA